MLRRAELALLAIVTWVIVVWSFPAHAESDAAKLAAFLGKVSASDIVPGADRIGPVREAPLVAPAYRGDQLLGHIFLNSQYVDANGYSGKPIYILVGLDPSGTIVGAKLVAHSEPIVLIGIPEHKVTTYLKAFVGYNPSQATAANKGPPQPDIVSGATVTVLVMGESVVRSALRVTRALQAGSAPAGARPAVARVVDAQVAAAADWPTLLKDGVVNHLHLNVGQVNKAFDAAGNPVAAQRPEPGPADADFIDLYAALVSQPSIGRSLLGDDEYASVSHMLAPGQQAILVAGDGIYSFKGSGYVRGGIFDRIEVIQGAETIRFRDHLHRRVGTLHAAGAPTLKEIGVFLIPRGREMRLARRVQVMRRELDREARLDDEQSAVLARELDAVGRALGDVHVMSLPEREHAELRGDEAGAFLHEPQLVAVAVAEEALGRAGFLEARR